MWGVKIMIMNVMEEPFEHIEMDDHPFLYTDDRISREAVPIGWYCYDLRGADSDPGMPATLENSVRMNHAGTLLTPVEVIFPTGQKHIDIEEKLNFLGEELTVSEFCAVHGFQNPSEPQILGTNRNDMLAMGGM